MLRQLFLEMFGLRLTAPFDNDGRLFAEPAVHHLTFFPGHAGENALAQGAERVVVRPQAGKQARPIHHALTERAVFPLALALICD